MLPSRFYAHLIPSKLLMNLAATILVFSSFILIGGPITGAFPDTNFPVTVILHFLSQFSWMSVMCFETVRKLNKLKTQQPNRFKRNLFITYRLIGWGLPLLVTVISIIVNLNSLLMALFSTCMVFSLMVLKEAGCWVNHFNSVLVVFVVVVVAITVIQLHHLHSDEHLPLYGFSGKG